MTHVNKNLFYILLVFAMLGWGGSWVNVKILSNYINEYEMIYLRFFITAMTMIPIIMYLKKSLFISLRNLILVLITSIAFILYMKYFFLGTKLGTASLGGAFVTSLIPINTFLILALFRQKTITKKDSFALVLGAVGVLTILNVWSFNLQSVIVTQNLYFILASIFWPIVTILSSKALKISPIVFTFYLYLITTLLVWIFFVDLSHIEYEKFDSIFWINLLAITLFASTFANTVYFLAVEKLGASGTSTFIFLVPFFAIILSVIFLNEEITLSIILGTIMTLFAIKILNNIKFGQSK
mgnify:CR=1 FL=1